MTAHVHGEHRGRGLGLELVREAVANGPRRELRRRLHTKDMHGLDARLGFRSPDGLAMERPPR